MKGQGNIFNLEQAGRVQRSAMDLSHEKKFTCDMGQLIPVLCMLGLPGDVIDIGNSAVVRMQPLVAPVLHEIDVETFYFAVPLRIIDDTFEEFITRGVTGNSSVSLPLFNPALFTTPANVVALGELWDFLGFPLVQPPEEVCPIDHPRRAYYEIWNQYFRDENLQTAVDITAYGTNHSIKRACWRKDYFTSALTFQQRGTAPALPVFGTASAEFNITDEVAYTAGNTVAPMSWRYDTDNSAPYVGNTMPGLVGASGGGYVNATEAAQVAENFSAMLSGQNSIDGSTFTSVDISDFRTTLALQVWMERNARGGSRYNEVLRKQFNAFAPDYRLQRPEFIGATKNKMIISEVLQTSSTDAEPTPQGNLAGHGIAVQRSGVNKYRCDEHMIIMGLMCVRPVPAYQNGINAQWLYRTTFDFPWPAFAGLSEQAIKNAEICTIPVADDPDGSENLTLFGYTGRYNEMRYMPSQVCSEMRTTFDYWHLGRQFDPATPPQLNAAFVECNPRKDIFAVPSVPGLIVSFGNHVRALRPLPFMAVPNEMGVG